MTRFNFLSTCADFFGIPWNRNKINKGDISVVHPQYVVQGRAIKLCPVGVSLSLKTLDSTCCGSLFFASKHLISLLSPIKNGKEKQWWVWGLISKALWHITVLFMVCGFDWCSPLGGRVQACCISIFTIYLKKPTRCKDRIYGGFSQSWRKPCFRHV